METSGLCNPPSECSEMRSEMLSMVPLLQTGTSLSTGFCSIGQKQCSGSFQRAVTEIMGRCETVGAVPQLCHFSSKYKIEKMGQSFFEVSEQRRGLEECPGTETEQDECCFATGSLRVTGNTTHRPGRRPLGSSRTTRRQGSGADTEALGALPIFPPVCRCAASGTVLARSLTHPQTQLGEGGGQTILS